MSLVLADMLLALSLLFVRQAPDGTWPARLALHALVLAGCLGAAALEEGAARGLCLLGAVAALLQVGLHAFLLRRLAAGPPVRRRPGQDGGVAWLLAGLVLVGLAARSVPASALPAEPRGMLAAMLGILLTGLLGAASSRTPAARCGALLLAGDGLLLSGCTLRGAGGLSLAGIVLLQGGLSWLLADAVRLSANAGEAGS